MNDSPLWSIAILGASNVIPWLSIISVTDFFQSKYPDGETQYVFPFLNFSCLLLTTLLNMKFGSRFGLVWRVFVPNSLAVLLLILISQLDNLVYIYAAFALLATCVATSQSTLYGVAGSYRDPHKFIVALESGKGAAGVYTIIIRIFCKLWVSDVTIAMTVFFSTSAIFVFCSLFSYVVLAADLRRNEGKKGKCKGKGKGKCKGKGKVDEESGLLRRKPAARMSRTIHEIILPAFAVFSFFMICISLFPGMATSLRSRTFNLGTYFPIIIVMVYNVCDLIGKRLPNCKKIESGAGLLILLFLVLLVIPFMVLEKLADEDHLGSAGGGKFFRNDVVKLGTVMALGVLTGYGTTSALILGPEYAPEEKRAFASQFMSVCLICGLFCGSFVGLLLDEELS
ncbi:hypothetical protein ScalyP_jg6565 [Parmales sp. scaly parma]|nr:hypothetical protein ScalyP_jg6565 [Parmales sp. scaly parma]